MTLPPVTHREHDVGVPESLAAAVRALESAPAIAVDVETDAMHAYRGRLCFVQLATADEIFVLDTLAPGVDAGALAAPFLAPERRKIFHDAQGDLRILSQHGLKVAGLFDTNRAATLLGLPRIGLGDLVEQNFGVKLSKEHQTANFGARPLPPQIRAYVANDVRYLIPLAELLEARARELGILEELELEFARIAELCAVPETLPRPKLPSSARGPLALAVAEAVDRIRHRLAEAKNLPVGRVLPNAAVGEIAARRPAAKADLARIPGVKGSVLREAGDEILAEIARLTVAHGRGELPPAPRPPGPPPDPHRRDRETALRNFRTGAATARGVTPTVVLPTSVLLQLASEPPPDLSALAATPWLGAKRVELYGEALLLACKAR